MVAEGNGRADESTAPQEDGAQAPAKDSKPGSDKHSLEHKWTLWFDNPGGKQKQDTWGSSLRSVYTFDTVEDFWWCAIWFVCLHNELHLLHGFTDALASQSVQQHQAPQLGSFWSRLSPLQKRHRT